MSKDTITICGMLLTGIIGLAGLMLHQSGSISELRAEMRAESQAQSAQIQELQQRVARIEGLLQELRPTLAAAPPAT